MPELASHHGFSKAGTKSVPLVVVCPHSICVGSPKIYAILTEAKSAKAPGWPVFNPMMERLYRGEADGILCWKLDRLASNPVDGGCIILAMKEQGMKIITPFQT